MKLTMPFVCFCLICACAGACGPFYDFTYIVGTNTEHLFRLPAPHKVCGLGGLPDDLGVAPAPAPASDALFVHRLCGIELPEGEEAPALSESVRVDVTDLYAALTESGAGEEQAEWLCQRYYAMRASFDPRVKDTQMPRTLISVWEALCVVQAIPAEFYRYLSAAEAFHRGQHESARGGFEEILALPPEQRRYRTVWAAFMLGRMSVEEVRLCTSDAEAEQRHRAEASGWLARVHAAIAEGCPDALNLAAGARLQAAELARFAGDVQLEITLLLEYAEAGGHDRAIGRLGNACMRAASQDKLPPEIMEDRACRAELADGAVSLSFYSAATSQNIIRAFRNSDLRYTPFEAGRLAWAAYRARDMEAAHEFAAAAPDDPYAQWTRSRLQLLAGDLDGAIASLRLAADHFPRGGGLVEPGWERRLSTDPSPLLINQQGVLLLARDRYVEALDLFVLGKNWLDAAFVAESVLTLDELLVYVHETKQRGAQDNLLPRSYGFYLHRKWPTGLEPPRATVPEWLRLIAARRMLRENRFEGAIAWFPPAWQPLASAYAHHRSAGMDRGLANTERATHLMQAGQLLRTWGLELIGFECDPDYGYEWGRLSYRDPVRQRLEPEEWTSSIHAIDAEGKDAGTIPNPLTPTTEERARLKAHRADPYRRWHYRFTASGLLWDAAALLPNNSEEKAQALYYGGMVLDKYTGDEEVLQRMDKFYKALVRTCRGLPIGEEADRERWFPKEPGAWAGQFTRPALSYAAASEYPAEG